MSGPLPGQWVSTSDSDMALRSMTGFGRGSATSPAGAVTVEVVSVNQRGLAVQCHLPSEWSELEPEVATQVRDVVAPA